MELERIELYENKYRFYINDNIKGETLVVEIPKEILFQRLSEAYFLIMKNLTVD